MSLELPGEVSIERSNAAVRGKEHVDGERHGFRAVEERRGDRSDLSIETVMSTITCANA